MTCFFGPIKYHFSDGFFWFRFINYGIYGKNAKKHRLYFSERKGYTKTLKIGNWIIGRVRQI